MSATDIVELESVAITIDAHTAHLDLPTGWRVEPGPPVVAMPPSWDGEPPGVAISIERDALCGDMLATALIDAALCRLGDPVVVSATLHSSCSDDDPDIVLDHDPDRVARDDEVRDVEVVVAHQHRGIDVTTIERHHCRPGQVRWVVGFTVAHPDVVRWLPLARRVVASLRARPS